MSGLHTYVNALQEAQTWTGRQAFCRAHRGVLPHERTVARWHEQLGSALAVSPRFALDGLGLHHVHAFLTDPRPGVEALPYVVDAAWVAKTCHHRKMYVHCLAPKSHLPVVGEHLRAHANEVELFVTGTGWERTITPGTAALPDVRAPTFSSSSLLRDLPMIVPAVFESHNATASLMRTWDRIRARLGSQVADYLGHRQHYSTNGKLHVRDAFSRLSQEGLFVQHAVRLTPPADTDIEAVVTLPTAQAAHLLETTMAACSHVECYPGEETCLLRLTGGLSLVQTLFGAEHPRVHWVTSQATTGDSPFRFAYERLFSPRNGTWLSPDGLR